MYAVVDLRPLLVLDNCEALGHDKAQSIIDQITAAYESSGGPPPGGFGFGPQHLGAPPPGFGPPPMGFGGPMPPPGFGGGESIYSYLFQYSREP